MTLRSFIPAVLAFTVAAGTCFAEDVEPGKFYKLDFVVKEVEGTKTLNSRSYSMVAALGNTHSSIRAGSKVPFALGGKKANAGPYVATTQYQNVDVGVNIDTNGFKEVQSRLSFSITADISSVAPGDPDIPSPLIRQHKWSSTVIVPFKKSTILFSSDNVDSKSQLELEVTAIPLP
jgi:hypothetical protein